MKNKIEWAEMRESDEHRKRRKSMAAALGLLYQDFTSRNDPNTMTDAEYKMVCDAHSRTESDIRERFRLGMSQE